MAANLESVLPYEQFSVRLPQCDIPQVDAILKSIPRRDVSRLQVCLGTLYSRHAEASSVVVMQPLGNNCCCMLSVPCWRRQQHPALTAVLLHFLLSLMPGRFTALRVWQLNWEASSRPVHGTGAPC